MKIENSHVRHKKDRNEVRTFARYLRDASRLSRDALLRKWWRYLGLPEPKLDEFAERMLA